MGHGLQRSNGNGAHCSTILAFWHSSFRIAAYLFYNRPTDNQHQPTGQSRPSEHWFSRILVWVRLVSLTSLGRRLTNRAGWEKGMGGDEIIRTGLASGKAMHGSDLDWGIISLILLGWAVWVACIISLLLVLFLFLLSLFIGVWRITVEIKTGHGCGAWDMTWYGMELA